MKLSIRMLARVGIIAGVYVALSYILAPISFGVFQFRVAEALTTLPILFPEAVPALFIGCLLSNIIGGLGPWDIFGGSAVTLVAAYLTYVFRRSKVAYVWPVVLNAVFVSLYLSAIFGMPYWITALSIGASETAIVLGIGGPLVKVLRRAGLG